jgi:ribonucleoside-diphosphate reductase alpha chain
MKVKKRDGSYQKFDASKIRKAVLAAFDAADENNITEIGSIVDCIITEIRGDLEVSEIQSIVEQQILDHGYLEVGAAYIAYRVEQDLLRSQRLMPKADWIADYIHAAKYAKYLPAVGRRETYSETVDRVREMHVEKFPTLRTDIEWAMQYVYDKMVLPSMRSMQFAGPAIKAHNARMFNCSFTKVNRLNVFGQIMYLLLCGCGVGYSVQWHHISMLPTVAKVGRKVKHHTIRDSIEGWAVAIDTLILESILFGRWVEFDYSLIRPEGAELVTSGGKAPGHLGLRASIENVRSILLAAGGRKLRPIEVHDIICHISDAVLSGGIRRSSLISLFSLADTEMLYAKTPGCFDPAGVNKHRALANNSVILQDPQRSDFERIQRIAREGYGEPGFFFSRSLELGCNPCGEVVIDPGDLGVGFCNLTEVNMAGNTDVLGSVRAAAILGTLQADYTDVGVPCNKFLEDRLLGVSLTGMCDNPESSFDPLLLQEMRKTVQETNKCYAKELGIPAALRTTCIKPSGTSSLELGCVASGIHPHHARRYFRRVIVNDQEPVGKIFRERNPHMVERVGNNWIITFPVQAHAGAEILADVDGREQLRRIILVKKNYIDGHNVSCTIATDDDLTGMIWENREWIGGLSFVPRGLDKIYPNAPREEVTSREDERRWNNLIELYTPIDWGSIQYDSGNQDLGSACDGDKCALS